MSTTQRPLIVLGAGVIGLTTAYRVSTDPVLSSLFKITVVARDLPEDMDSQAWSSPWAGANWSPMPMGGEDERIKRWETTTFNKFWDMIPSGLVKELPSRKYGYHATDYSNVWWKDLVRNFRIMEPSEIPEGYKSGLSFSTISVSPVFYLPWLTANLVNHGVNFVRKTVRSLDELSYLAKENGILVNATALGSRSILGIEDTALYPIRGQTILVRCPSLQEFLALEGDEYSDEGGEATYIIPRPGAGDAEGTALIGGTFQVRNWDTSLNMDTARSIFMRCASLAPCLLDKGTEVLKHNVGLRPAREGGPRVEVGRVKLPLGDGLRKRAESGGNAQTEAKDELVVVHAYGFGAAGYQSSWGAVEDVVSLLKGNI
ncbi:hypothetical protein SERLA73DRAFT_69752 [Serpula lacrymans var. lacrymans S7.3]|uniref:FAD dependent oxidoreductase domain-containing protein n=2 Tax=Serpula lacrymans var. lacrymans TaxID=341189 RepID=F8PL34_SERL3|nr:uncharacterized protein SERLADRAFT_458189 [Serpula lacrymans var. lacrymans S7.9]EGO03942.1 hypothetical protein SERLA73DRAFT_69752 [Serpula lacrymans var. lacrymans S7.3]EGO29863.1 hypothetical protein SERLADRAFT_458189 [Serpula lacrymans var. lacrymans S7.9]